MIRRTFIALAATTALASPAFSEAHTMNIVETAQEAGTFTTLLAAAEAAGLAGALTEPGPFTVFAPSDDAFAALPEGTVDDLLMEENQDQLIATLRYHIVSGAVMSGDLSDGMTAPTLEGSDVTISIDGDTVMVNEATVTQADIEASNGVIHVIDSVLMPAM